MRAGARRRCWRPRPSARTRRRAFWSRCLRPRWRPGRHPRNTRLTPKWPPSDPASHAARPLPPIRMTPLTGEKRCCKPTRRVPPGVDDAAKVKASFLAAVAHGELAVESISKARATELLGTMGGGYNVQPLIELLAGAPVAGVAGEGLKKTLLMFDFFNDVGAKARAGHAKALEVMHGWADAQWFTCRPEVAQKITVTVFKVPGETNTDDLSPAPDAWSRPDIPLHALAMLKNRREGAAFTPEKDGQRGPMQFIADLKSRGHLVAYVGDVVGTGSSRKSASNSLIWATGQDIPFVPNKRFGGVTLGGKIAPIFFNAQEDSGALPIEVDVSRLEMGDVLDILPYEGLILRGGQTV